MALNSKEATQEVLALWVIAETGTPQEQAAARLQIAGMANAAGYLSHIFTRDHNRQEYLGADSIQRVIKAWFE